MEAEAVAWSVGEQVAADGARVIALTGYDEPSVIVLHPDVGLIAVDIDATEGDASNQAPFVSLNRKLHSLRQTLGLDAKIPIARVVLHENLMFDEPILSIGGRTRISPKQLVDASWLDRLQKEPLAAQMHEQITARLFPEFTFTSTFRTHSHDPGAGDREALRISLDAQQALIAQRDDIRLALLKGPPGSGKSLVLAARARWLAQRHPDWRIRVLCYNRALLPYLEGLTAGYANVTVSLFSRFAQDLGVRFSFKDDAVTYQGLSRARSQGITPIADAILVDEYQDFRPPWLVIAWEGLVTGRGGMMLAGDGAQALYHDEELPACIREQGIEVLSLQRPYRSTRSILEAFGALNAGFEVASADSAPDGEPVELIWAESWDEQAKVVAWEINLMLSGEDRRAGDIAILVTTKWGTLRRLREVLTRSGVPFTVVDKENAADFDRSSDTVKIMTVHSAKGHEFPVVFLFGLEALPSFDATKEESVRRGRVGFVGATRAKDQLLITYTRDNEYLKVLSEDKTHVRRWLWPDSYEGVAADG